MSSCLFEFGGCIAHVLGMEFNLLGKLKIFQNWIRFGIIFFVSIHRFYLKNTNGIALNVKQNKTFFDTGD